MATVEAPNRRLDDRFRFSPAYTRVVVVPSSIERPGQAGVVVDDDGTPLDLSGFDLLGDTPPGGLEGHGYDVSLTGMRFELDEELSAGTEVSIQLLVPGDLQPVRMRGVVVRVFSHDDDPGPRRMAVQFTAFDSPTDRERLVRRIDARSCCWPG
jgi:PilZ domain